jgi:4-diphosphocytidyl-2-C-methyl-D-erythritol kinase
MSIKLKSYAKINIALRVLNKRNDGFHNIETIFTSISLHDNITVSKSKDVEVVCSDPTIPSGSENIAYKAVLAIKEEFGIKEGAKVFISKNIPAGAGLAGGSGNAAATVKGCLALWNIKPSAAKLNKILSSLGSDVPYCYFGGTSLGKGRGEILRKLEDFSGFSVLLVNPAIHISTPLAYRLLKRELTVTEKKVSLLVSYNRFLTNRLLLCDLLENDFEEVVFDKYPLIGKIKEDLLKLGADGAVMSGSGSTVFGLFRNRKALGTAKGFFCNKGYMTFKAELLKME